jgi:hypothetical protein
MKIGRNEPCPCGSGKKYKHCCGGAQTPHLKTPQSTTAEPAEPWTAAAVARELGNPLLVGMGPFPKMATEDEWEKIAVRLVEEVGVEQFLANALGKVRDAFTLVTGLKPSDLAIGPSNMIAAGIGPFPQLVLDAEWIQNTAQAMRARGVGPVGRQMVSDLKTVMEASYITEKDSMWQSALEQSKSAGGVKEGEPETAWPTIRHGLAWPNNVERMSPGEIPVPIPWTREELTKVPLPELMEDPALSQFMNAWLEKIKETRYDHYVAMMGIMGKTRWEIEAWLESDPAQQLKILSKTMKEGLPSEAETQVLENVRDIGSRIWNNYATAFEFAGVMRAIGIIFAEGGSGAPDTKRRLRGLINQIEDQMVYFAIHAVMNHLADTGLPGEKG